MCVFGISCAILIIVGLMCCCFKLVFPSLHVTNSPRLETTEEWKRELRRVQAREGDSATEGRGSAAGSCGHCAEGKKLCVRREKAVVPLL